LFAGSDGCAKHFNVKIHVVELAVDLVKTVAAVRQGQRDHFMSLFAGVAPIGLKLRRNIGGICQQKLLLARGAHHLDRGWIAIHEHLTLWVQHQNRIRAALEQHPEHWFSINHFCNFRTGPFVPLSAQRVPGIHARVKTEFISNAGLDEGKFPKPAANSQARRGQRRPALNAINTLAINRRMKLPVLHDSPFVQLAAARARRNLRLVPLAGAEHVVYPSNRQTLARVRAAELAEWQNSGGDFLKRSPAANILLTCSSAPKTH